MACCVSPARGDTVFVEDCDEEGITVATAVEFHCWRGGAGIFFGIKEFVARLN